MVRFTVNAKANTLLYEFRKKMGLTQLEFAKQTGISHPTIKAIENGRRALTPTILARIEATCPSNNSNSIIEVSATLQVGFETEAMNRVYLALLPLSPDARARVIAWVMNRLDSEKKTV